MLHSVDVYLEGEYIGNYYDSPTSIMISVDTTNKSDDEVKRNANIIITQYLEQDVEMRIDK